MSKNFLNKLDNKIKEKLAKQVKEFRRLFPDPIVWKLIPNYTKYEVSEDGRVRNTWTGKILKQYTSSGYYYVKIRIDDKVDDLKVHRLVAMVFILNPNNLPVVDHIDNNKLNNHVSNLRWITQKENIQSYNDNFRKFSIILQYDLNEKFIKKWKNTTQIIEENENYKRKTINVNLRGRSKTAYGFIWKYETPKKKKISKLYNDEIFKNIGVFENNNLSNYIASNYGKIKNNRGMILSTHIDNGYVCIYLTDKNKIRKHYKVHRLVAATFVPNYILSNNIVNHIDENRSNNYYKNLEWVTQRKCCLFCRKSCQNDRSGYTRNTNNIQMHFRCI